MPYPIEKKFVVAVSASALFDMAESDHVFKTEGIRAYRKYQETNINNCLGKGVAFPFISRFLSLNDSFPEEQPVEVVLFSKDTPETGIRVRNSIKDYNLNITRGCFTSGRPNYQYLPAINATLFLSCNPQDTKDAIMKGYAAGTVLKTTVFDDAEDKELRIAFDFDGVLSDDDSERFYQDHKDNIVEYMEHEKNLADFPLDKGPLSGLLQKISFFQKQELKKEEEDPNYHHILTTSIVTARNAPADERVVSTLKAWDVSVDEVFFLGGIEKKNVLDVMKPHIFFDDQMTHLTQLTNIPAVHIPFGITNEKSII